MTTANKPTIGEAPDTDADLLSVFTTYKNLTHTLDYISVNLTEILSAEI